MEFWKVVVWVGAHGMLSVGLVVSQSGIADEVRKGNSKPKDVPFVNVDQWRVSIADIQTNSNLTFDPASITGYSFRCDSVGTVSHEAFTVEDYARLLQMLSTIGISCLNF